MKSFEELTDSEASGTGGVGPWIPEDVYADLILDGVICYGQLSGVVTAMEYDFTKGGGDTIQVRYINARTTSCTSQGKTDETECICLSESSSNFGTYNVYVQAWGDYDLICNYSMWEASGPAQAMIADEMGKRLALCRDQEIWSNLVTDVGTPNIDIESTVSCMDGEISGSCCTFTYDLYNSIVSVMKHMQGDAYNPDYVIMHPEVAAYLYFRDAAGYFFTTMPGTTFKDGKLATLAGLTVIESCNAAKCTDTASAVMAVVIDSSRAVGEVWGKRPTFQTDPVIECDQTKLVVWMYWGSSPMDSGAIGWISNPS